MLSGRITAFFLLLSVIFYVNLLAMRGIIKFMVLLNETLEFLSIGLDVWFNVTENYQGNLACMVSGDGQHIASPHLFLSSHRLSLGLPD